MPVYLTAAIIGVGLVLVTFLLGGDSDSEMETELDGELEGDGHDGGGFDILGWLPITSLRFWTFFLAGFGLVGIATQFGKLATALAVPISVGAGYVAGIAVSALYRKLHATQTDSSVTPADYVGSDAKVILPVGSGRTGKIRLSVKGMVIELLAESEGESDFVAGDTVTIYQVNAEGHALVTGKTDLGPGPEDKLLN